MDSRWSLCFTGGLLSGLLGCTSPQTRPPADAAQGTPMPNATALSKMIQPAPATPTGPTKLKPSTYVSLGTLKEQLAEDADRPQPEREAARQQARASYQKALDLDAKYVPAYLALAKSYTLTGERERSQAMFQKAVALAPKDASVPLEQGICLARVKDWDSAVECLTRSVQLEPSNLQAQKWLGLTLTRAGHYDEGYTVLTKCMPEAEAHYNLARMLQHNQQPAAAEQQLRLALQSDPNFEPAKALLTPADRPAADTGVRTVSHEEPATAPASPRLLPVMLGDTSRSIPVPAGGDN